VELERFADGRLGEPRERGLTADAVAMIDKPSPRELTSLLHDRFRGSDVKAHDLFQAL
jgi:hypothetical protein